MSAVEPEGGLEAVVAGVLGSPEVAEQIRDHRSSEAPCVHWVGQEMAVCSPCLRDRLAPWLADAVIRAIATWDEEWARDRLIECPECHSVFEAEDSTVVCDHTNRLATPKAAGGDAGLRARVEALAGEHPDCWVTRSSVPPWCTDFIGGTFGSSKFVEAMCCLPCRLRAALAATATEAGQ